MRSSNRRMGGSPMTNPSPFTDMVDRMVPLVAEMLLALKVADPLHLDVVGLADRTLLQFLNILREREHLTNSESAMLMGRSLSAFYERKRRLEETAASGGVAELRAVYDAVVAQTGGSPSVPIREWQILERLPDLHESTLAAALRYLVRFGILTVSRTGRDREYRLVPGPVEAPMAYQDLMVTLYSHGPMTRDALQTELGLDPASLDELLHRLQADGHLERLPPEDGSSAPRVRATGFHIGLDEAEGWYAATWIHFRAVCEAIIAKARQRVGAQAASDVVGGMTFDFDIPADTPIADEIAGFLSSTRDQMEAWLVRVRELEAAHPDRSKQRITIYAGQLVKEL